MHRPGGWMTRNCPHPVRCGVNSSFAATWKRVRAQRAGCQENGSHKTSPLINRISRLIQFGPVRLKGGDAMIVAKRFVAFCLAALFCAEVPTHSRGEDLLVFKTRDSPVIRVEESWCFRITEPDSITGLPSFSNLISPDGTDNWEYAIFELNRESEPDYVKGGMQIQSWLSDSLNGTKNAPISGALSHQGESVEYTIAMYLTAGWLHFEIIDGKSETWGDFGGKGYLKISVPTTRTNLNSYSTAHSIANYEVLTGAHCVEKVELQNVRLYRADGSSSNNSDLRVKYEYQDEVIYKTYEEYEASKELYTLEKSYLLDPEPADSDAFLAL